MKYFFNDKVSEKETDVTKDKQLQSKNTFTKITTMLRFLCKYKFDLKIGHLYIMNGGK